MIETKRRTVVKSLLWRVIGVIWTWLGAYFIILLIPENMKKASIIATLIVIYHHSTRLVMYYFYERIWATINWGKIGFDDIEKPMSMKKKLYWTSGTIFSITAIMCLILFLKN
jgi:hypothetical protein